MIGHFLNTILGGSSDNGSDIAKQVLAIMLPIVYTIGGLVLIGSCIRFGFQLHSSPQDKAIHIRNFVWAVVGSVVIFMGSGIANVLLVHFGVMY